MENTAKKIELKQFEIIKKNRKWFDARLGKSKIKCKLLIDDESEMLEIGTHMLEVEDISDRTKYGVVLKFKMMSEPDISEVVTLKADYNEDLVERCRELGGTFSSESGVWIFPEYVEDEVDELDFIYNSKKVAVELTFNSYSDYIHDSIKLLGNVIGTAYSRDSGAKIGENISVIKGDVTSGGSVKNWRTVITEGTVIRLKLPVELLKKGERDGIFKERDIEVKRI